MPKLMIQSGHNFVHATTAQLPWHVQNYDRIGSLRYVLEQKMISVRFESWALDPIVRFVPGAPWLLYINNW